jgi:hypothetical protein
MTIDWSHSGAVSGIIRCSLSGLGLIPSAHVKLSVDGIPVYEVSPQDDCLDLNIHTHLLDNRRTTLSVKVSSVAVAAPVLTH